MITEDQFNSIQVGCNVQLENDIFPAALRGVIAVVISKESKHVVLQDPRYEVAPDSQLYVYREHIMNVFTRYDDDFNYEINESILL